VNNHGLEFDFSGRYAAEWFSFAVLSTAKEKDPFLCDLCGEKKIKE
jgi:hypothetical protein